MKSFSLMLVTTFLALSIIFSFINFYLNDSNDLENIRYVQVTVEEGDSLWNIAKPFYDGKSDYRELIYQIKKLNDLEQVIIYPGQVLKIPLL